MLKSVRRAGSPENSNCQVIGCLIEKVMPGIWFSSMDGRMNCWLLIIKPAGTEFFRWLDWMMLFYRELTELLASSIGHFSPQDFTTYVLLCPSIRLFTNALSELTYWFPSCFGSALLLAIDRTYLLLLPFGTLKYYPKYPNSNEIKGVGGFSAKAPPDSGRVVNEYWTWFLIYKDRFLTRQTINLLLKQTLVFSDFSTCERTQIIRYPPRSYKKRVGNADTKSALLLLLQTPRAFHVPAISNLDREIIVDTKVKMQSFSEFPLLVGVVHAPAVLVKVIEIAAKLRQDVRYFHHCATSILLA